MSSRLHVFHLIKGLGRGGAETLLLQGLQCADRKTFDFSYGYFLPSKAALAPALERLGARVEIFPARTAAGIILSVPRLAAYLRTGAVNLVHCHLPVSGVAGRLAGRLANVPVVYTEHNVQERYRGPTRCANLATWSMQHLVFAVSAEVRASLTRRLRSRVPIEVLPNGVSAETFRPDPRAGLAFRSRHSIPPDAPLIAQVAVFRAQKKLDVWLRVAQEVRRRIPQSRFLLVGDGPQRQSIEALARQLGIDAVTHFPGILEDVRPALAATDLLLVSSAFEGLPVAILEAMAMEVPVVATAVGGIPEAVLHGHTGLLVDSGNAPGLSRAVVDLLSDPHRRDRYGRAARARVIERFSIQAMQAGLEQGYLRVLQA